MSEFDLIKKIGVWEKKYSKFSAPALKLGMGDDCAIVSLNALKTQNKKAKYLVSSIDTMISNVHFFETLTSAKDLGYKLISRTISDIAAMGASPFGVSVALNLPKNINEKYLESLYKGIFKCLNEQNSCLIGGDISSSKQFSLTAHVFGCSELPPIKRSSAKINDDIWVSGKIGGAMKGLEIKKAELKNKEKNYSPLEKLHLKRLERPKARTELGQELLNKKIANSMIDISDGLLADLNHIISQSNLSCSLDLKSIPLEKGIEKTEKNTLKASSAGEDYELIFTSSPKNTKKIEALSSKVKLTKIGKVTSKNTTHKTFSSEGISINSLLKKHQIPISGGFQHKLN